MPDSLWKNLRRLQPGVGIQTSDVDRYLDSAVVSWSQSCVEDGAADWVLQWWKANAFEFPSMRSEWNVCLVGLETSWVSGGSR
ncbi:hypothetical protein H2204_015493 [Knufia peltigerae]|uniref:Uncharacterized protein n=1 Tax=Knufia peltigerae TaxID=1002370 RepID=A0AA38XAW3_9EURO|nr:hypothetical protein H2204_015493 [Knufia peltigerae]